MRVWASRAPNGSSMSHRSGSMAKVRAMATRCCMPWDSWDGYASAKLPTLTVSSSSQRLLAAFPAAARCGSPDRARRCAGPSATASAPSGPACSRCPGEVPRHGLTVTEQLALRRAHQARRACSGWSSSRSRSGRRGRRTRRRRTARSTLDNARSPAHRRERKATVTSRSSTAGASVVCRWVAVGGVLTCSAVDIERVGADGVGLLG